MSHRPLLFILLFSLSWMGFSSTLGKTDLWAPEGWKPYSQRPALMPHMSLNRETRSLQIASTGNFRCNGAWRRSFPVTEKVYYTVRAEYLGRHVALPRRSILVKVDWRDADGKRVSQPDYPSNLKKTSQEWQSIEGTYLAPDGAVTVVVDLIFRWDEKGRVEWKSVSFQAAPTPRAQEVILATVNYRPRNTSNARENLELFAEYLVMAGEAGADIVCLPEAITMVGTSRTYVEAAEPIPGPSTDFLGKLAKKFSMYIVAGLLEQTADTVHNTAVLIDRRGKVVGTYRKVSLPREEIEGGITPGSNFPVYETDFGKVGMMICWDVQFPEPARRLAASGAEIILMPIWGGNEPLFPARSIENQIYLVTSSYDSRTGIWDREGKLVAEASKNGSLTFQKIDLSKGTQWEWLGDLRSRIPREAPPAEEEP